MRGGSAAKRDRLLRPRARLARVGGYAVSLDVAHGLDNTGWFQSVPRYGDDTSGVPTSTSAPGVSTSSGSATHPAGVSPVTSGTALSGPSTSTLGPAPETTA